MELLIDETVTVSGAVRTGTEFLMENGVDNAAFDSFALLSDITGMSRNDYYIYGSRHLGKDEVLKFKEYLMNRANHIPLQHILGKTYFYGYEFAVNNNVLIPRQDTEVLVEEALKIVQKGARVMDMCTGSGCIIISIGLEAELSNGFGIDLSEKALKVAELNCNNLGACGIEFIQSDVFESLDNSKYGKLDLLISNPPYIRSDVIPTLSDEVRLHDPMMALDGFDDGLFFYRKITTSAGMYLKSGGWLMFEIGHDQGSEVSELMKTAGFEEVSVIKDLAGLDRVVRGRLR